MSTVLHDLRHGLRTLAKSPGFTVTTVLCLALGIGGTTAMFSLVHAVLLRPLPFENSDRLLVLRSESPIRGLRDYRVSVHDFLDYQEQSQSFDGMAGYQWQKMDLIGKDSFERLQGLLVSRDFFNVLRLQPELGRTFARDELERTSQVVVLAHGNWTRLFGVNPESIGSEIRVNSWKNFPDPGTETLNVIGVMPADIRFLPATAGPVQNGIGINDVVDYWRPAGIDRAENTKRDDRNVEVVARLKEGVSIDQAQADLTAIARRLQELYPETNKGWSVRAIPLSECVSGEVRLPLLLLLGAVGCVLVLACCNVAHLVLIRSAARQKEIATRTAVGASPMRLFRQLLTESLLLAAIGSVMGLILAWWTKDLVVALAPNTLPRFDAVRMDAPVLGFTLLVSLLTAAGVGVVPAIRATRFDLNSLLKSGAASTTVGPGRRRMGNLLVVGQIALTLVLLVGAGLMIKSFRRVMDVNPGFQAEKLLSLTISLPGNQNSWEYNSTFCNQVRHQVAGIPGVESATAIRGGPMSGTRIGFEAADVEVEGRPFDPLEKGPAGYIHVVADDYFRTMKIPLLRGRVLTEMDAAGPVGSVNSVVINETMARRFWPNEDALGKRFRFHRVEGFPWVPVVGIVGDATYSGLDRNVSADIYYQERNFPQGAITMLVRTTADPLDLVSAVRNEVRTVNRHAFITDVKTMEQILSDSQSHRRFTMLLLTVFSTIALGLAVTGIYGVTAYSVAQRNRELGIRAALGALPADLIRLVLKQGFAQILLGTALGLVAAVAARRLLAAMLYGVSPTDPATVAVVIALMTSTALGACYVPARRASKVDPKQVLQSE